MYLFEGHSYYDTTVVIGNGFDLNLGMDTSYKSFFKVLKDEQFFEDHKDNPLLWHIYQWGEQKNWYDFEAIIKKYATDSEQSFLLKSVHELCTDIDTWKRKCFGTLDISRYQILAEPVSPSIKKLVGTRISDINTYLQIIDDIKDEINSFCQKCRKEAKEAIDLLTEELKRFLQGVSAKTEYDNPAIFLFFAALGITGKGYRSLVEILLCKFADSDAGGDLPKNCIVSFNYTDTAKNILKLVESKVGIGLVLMDDDPQNEIVNSIRTKIFNVHGTLQDKIAFGSDKDIKAIPKEFYCLMKCNYTKEDELENMKEILFHSKRVVFFGHCIYGIDFEYYKDFFRQKKNSTEVYIVSHNKDANDQMRKELESRSILGCSYHSVLLDGVEFDNLLRLISGEEKK